MHQVEPESVEVECTFCHHMLKIAPQDLLGVLRCPACKALIEVEPEAQRPTVRFDCPECGSGVDVPLEHSREIVRCPHCARHVRPADVEVSWEEARQWIKVGLPKFLARSRAACEPAVAAWRKWCKRRRAAKVARIRRRQEEREAARRRMAAYQESQRQLALVRQKAEQEAEHRRQEMIWEPVDRFLSKCKGFCAQSLKAYQDHSRAQAYRQAVLEGRFFDCDILVEELKNDWVEIQRLPLDELRMRQRFKLASPLVGGGAWRLGAPPWLAALIGIGTYLASGPVSRSNAEARFLEWHAKCGRILSNLSKEQMWLLDARLRARYPYVHWALDTMSQRMLP